MKSEPFNIEEEKHNHQWIIDENDYIHCEEVQTLTKTWENTSNTDSCGTIPRVFPVSGWLTKLTLSTGSPIFPIHAA